MVTITPSPRIAVIVVAGGSGTRLGAHAPKAFVGIDDRTILRHCLGNVFAAPLAQVVIVAPAGREGDALTEAYDAAGTRRDLVSVVTGGATRQSSVDAGLAAVWAEVEIVLVHDAARALTPPDVFARVVDAIEDGHPGALPVQPVVDTIKRVESGVVVGVVDRAELSAAQTPQGFRRDVLVEAYAAATADFTDDAALVATRGHVVAAVDGDDLAFKITTPADLERARGLVAPRRDAHRAPSVERAPALPRIGIGTDVHGYGGEGDLWLAGLHWPGERALSGHSDGDAVSHAIVDALLSAAGLGDIGTHFGTDRPEYAGAHADAFLARTHALVAEAGFRIGNVAVQFQANRPRLAGRRADAEQALSAALGGAPVTLSATTTDGLAFTGRGEGVAAYAVALILPV
ncbi:2-C-methyl-D-erythritol 4-phosphate cytidylyltransferase [Microbacterium hominis]|uniref:Bifunctional enzyme IspD/IspF n=1 Tax=Microbacterium hominis TaxID=162426 RepID=A0A7D4QBT3_9MICO|nr:2-C-methyl-D-erythritol 4-phosphate cytidylyltransferase [Microbacterium hominis]QKJ18817.1 2-C-methyl-D-erythritol 4-phosphate cytidylyltransferase [Microbacterium hominis]